MGNTKSFAAGLVLVLGFLTPGTLQGQEKIELRNSMNTPITVLVQPEQQPAPTQLRLLVDQTRDYPLKWAGLYALQVVPDDMPDSGYFLGSHDLRAVAKSLDGRPLELRGEFQLYYVPATETFFQDLRERVAVYYDVPQAQPVFVTRTRSSRLTDYMQGLTAGRGPNEPQPGPRNAVITVIVPPNARVFFDGQPTTSTGAVRSYYSTPELTPNKTYKYRVKVEWKRDGHACESERDVGVRAGELTRQYFKMPFLESPETDRVQQP